jgi:hypothetical protein
MKFGRWTARPAVAPPAGLRHRAAASPVGVFPELREHKRLVATSFAPISGQRRMRDDEFDGGDL